MLRIYSAIERPQSSLNTRSRAQRTRTNSEKTMACWSAENAIKAYLRTLKLEKREEEQGLDIAEFISALAAGNNALLMVVACAGAADSTTLALLAAAHQTGGRVVCILPGLHLLSPSKEALGSNATHVEFVIGEAQNLLSNDYLEAGFVVVDCNLGNHEDIIRAMHAGRRTNGSIVVGYNAFCSGSWQSSGKRVQLLPIGGGLLVSRISATDRAKNGSFGWGKSHWDVQVDKRTGEEHVFRVKFPHGKR